jgi:Prokaryotic N-terminal methylation motif
MRAPFFPLLARRDAHGFTLVELMVAMTGGLFLSIWVFMLARHASRFYQRESRVANATLSGVSGFERLSSDVARAGHLVTANIAADPRVCNRPAADWPAMLRTLRAVVIEENTTASDATEVGAAGIKPKGIVLAGALNMSEVLTTASVVQDGSGNWEISLNTSTPAAARVGLSPSNSATAANLAVLQSIFLSNGNGRIVRLRKKGIDQYGVVNGVASSAGTLTALALVNLKASPQLVRPVSGGIRCGIEGNGEDMDLSVIDLVRYNIRGMVTDLNYASLFKASGLETGGTSSTSALPYEGQRAELVRVELTPDGAEIDATREIVGEYAVDLQLNAWRAKNAADPTLIPVDEAVSDSYASTQLLRGLNVRLSVRSREADREANVAGVGGTSADIYRIPLGPSKGAPYARVRTLQSNVPLRNLESSNW